MYWRQNIWLYGAAQHSHRNANTMSGNDIHTLMT